eukprot:3926446-Pleurochrysis_carterae.AAC.1
MRALSVTLSAARSDELGHDALELLSQHAEQRALALGLLRGERATGPIGRWRRPSLRRETAPRCVAADFGVGIGAVDILEQR